MTEGSGSAHNGAIEERRVKRIDLWIDCEDDETDCIKSEAFLRSLKVTSRFVGISEILESSKRSK